MKIVVISDTHIPQSAQDIPKKLYDDLSDADMILHAGDIASLGFLKKLQKLADTKAVCGNMDELEIKNILPQKLLVTIGKHTIGLIHGYGKPTGLLDFVWKEFLSDKPDIIVFGHSHQPLNISKNGTLFFNPGSPTDKIFTTVNSYGIITIDEKDNLKLEIIKLNG